MKSFSRYPHVKDLISHYAEFFSLPEIVQQISSGVTTLEEAEAFSWFIWKMADLMRIDSENKTVVLGSLDNSEMLPDVYYEVSSFMADSGFEETWEKICEQA